MSSKTKFLSRFIGLYELIVALAMFAHKQDMLEAVTGLLRDRPLVFLVGLITVALGLALVLAHNVWSGGALAVLVTVIGWITLIKGSLFMCLPPDAVEDLFLRQLRYEQFYYGYCAIALILGIYLTGAGFRRAAR